MTRSIATDCAEIQASFRRYWRTPIQSTQDHLDAERHLHHAEHGADDLQRHDADRLAGAKKSRVVAPIAAAAAHVMVLPCRDDLDNGNTIHLARNFVGTDDEAVSIQVDPNQYTRLPSA